MRKYLIIIAIAVIICSVPLFLKKKDNLGGELVAITPDKTCVDLLNLSIYTKEQAAQAQNCLKMMIDEIQSDGWTIGDQGKMPDKDDISRLYQQKAKLINLDTTNKLIQKATLQEVSAEAIK